MNVKFKKASIKKTNKDYPCALLEMTSGSFKGQQFYFSNRKDIRVQGESMVTADVNTVGNTESLDYILFKIDALNVLAQIVDKLELEEKPISEYLYRCNGFVV